MKTIFISMFEGVEAKNLLRTGVIDRLLRNEEIRVVLLMKNKERVSYYQKQFSHPRLLYEVVPYDRGTPRGFDGFFSFLKFQLLRTETTNIRRAIALEENRSRLVYWFLHILNFILARPLFVRFFRFFDQLLVRDITYRAIFETYKPSLVFVAHLFEEPEINILREAKRRRVRSIGLINSWDKTTARAVMRLIPDRLIVFNQYVKREVILYHAVPEKRIVVSGVPQYDAYTLPVKESRDAYLKRMGFDPANKLVVFAPFGRSFNKSMWITVDMLHRMASHGDFGDKVSLLVRFQPNDFLDEDELKKRPWLIYDYPGKRFSSTRGVDWDMDEKDIEHLKSTLFSMDLLICYASSITLDAMLYRKPVINIGFEIGDARAVEQPTRHYQFEHYRHILDSGAITFVKNEEELKHAARSLLEHPQLNEVVRNKVIQEQVEFLDGKSAERIAHFITSML